MALLISVADDHWARNLRPGVPLITTPPVGVMVVRPVPVCIKVICEPTGNATDEFSGTVRVLSEPLLISTILFLSVNTSVYDTDAVVVDKSANLPRSIAAVVEISALAMVPSRIIVLVTVPDGRVTVPVNVGEANLA